MTRYATKTAGVLLAATALSLLPHAAFAQQEAAPAGQEQQMRQQGQDQKAGQNAGQAGRQADAQVAGQCQERLEQSAERMRELDEREVLGSKVQIWSKLLENELAHVQRLIVAVPDHPLYFVLPRRVCTLGDADLDPVSDCYVLHKDKDRKKKEKEKDRKKKDRKKKEKEEEEKEEEKEEENKFILSLFNYIIS